jgi:ethanolamine utilization microcompartment shell protein EutS
MCFRMAWNQRRFTQEDASGKSCPTVRPFAPISYPGNHTAEQLGRDYDNAGALGISKKTDRECSAISANVDNENPATVEFDQNFAPVVENMNLMRLP